jgi:hypothetical protein
MRAGQAARLIAAEAMIRMILEEEGLALGGSIDMQASLEDLLFARVIFQLEE